MYTHMVTSGCSLGSVRVFHVSPHNPVAAHAPRQCFFFFSACVVAQRHITTITETQTKVFFFVANNVGRNRKDNHSARGWRKTG